MFPIDITSGIWSEVNGPVKSVVFSLCISIKLIVTQPSDKPHANVSKLPIYGRKRILYDDSFTA